MNRNKVYLKLYFPLSHHWAVLYREHFLSPLLVTSRGLLPQPRMGGSGCWISKGDVADAKAWIIMACALPHSFALWHLGDDACEFTLLHVLFLSSLISIFSLRAVLAVTKHCPPSAKFSNANGVVPIYRNRLSLGPVHPSASTCLLVV